MNIHTLLDDDLRDQAADFVFATAPSPARAAYRAHLVHCAPCSAEVQALEQLRDELLLAAPQIAPPPSTWQQLEEQLEPHAQQHSTSRAAHAADEPAAHTAHEPAAQVWKSWLGNGAASTADALTFVPAAQDAHGDWQATGVEGLEVRRLFVDRENDRITMLARMAPGCSYPGHIHAGPEECFVLSGDLSVGELHMRGGDYQRAERGSVHGVQSTRAGCVLLLVSSLRDELLA